MSDFDAGLRRTRWSGWVLCDPASTRGRLACNTCWTEIEVPTDLSRYRRYDHCEHAFPWSPKV